LSVKIYAEGGGEGQLYDTLFRQGWQAFFKAAGLSGRLPSVVRGKGRQRTYELFVTAVTNPRSRDLPLLLVDSEGPIAAGHTPWQHLHARDGWSKPAGTAENQVFLMVQLMETWFLADRDLLRRYFGHELRENALRAWPNLEEVPKETVLAVLDQATAGCRLPYRKGKVSFGMLEGLNPLAVENACPRAKLFLDHLRKL
jgi:hypothetical protein